MKYLQKALAGIFFLGTMLVPAYAFQPKEIASYFNGPTISSITPTTATASLSQEVLAGLTDEEKAGIYFEYRETHQVCIMIYPTPANCLPKKTELGKTSVTLTDLKPNTSYTITYKKDNTIYCITAPCPGNGFESSSAEFVTANNSTSVSLIQNLFLGSRGSQVILLQTMLVRDGYLSVSPTGYFGPLTFQAVRNFQRDHGVIATGYVGPITRNILNQTVPSPMTAESFEGTITAYSTDCFFDGECSITVDGKKVITTIGWNQEIVGKVLGIADFGSVANKTGSKAKVYARKTANGYTLYGSADYYIYVY